MKGGTVECGVAPMGGASWKMVKITRMPSGHLSQSSLPGLARNNAVAIAKARYANSISLDGYALLTIGRLHSEDHGKLPMRCPSMVSAGPSEATMRKTSMHVRNRTSLLDHRVTASTRASRS